MSRVQRSGGDVVVDVSSHAAGTVTALTGPFAAEWVCEATVATEPGATVRLTLPVGDQADADLLRVRHDDGSGSVAVAEQRVDGTFA